MDRPLHGRVTVVAEHLSDPRNLERLEKVCGAFGAALRLVRAEASPRSVAQGLEGLTAVAYGTALEGNDLYATAFGHGHVALVFGQERHGLSQEALKLLPRRLRIPMLGMAQSLNVAASAAVVLTEAGKSLEERLSSQLESVMKLYLHIISSIFFILI